MKKLTEAQKMRLDRGYQELTELLRSLKQGEKLKTSELERMKAVEESVQLLEAVYAMG